VTYSVRQPRHQRRRSGFFEDHPAAFEYIDQYNLAHLVADLNGRINANAALAGKWWQG